MVANNGFIVNKMILMHTIFSEQLLELLESNEHVEDSQTEHLLTDLCALHGGDQRILGKMIT